MKRRAEIIINGLVQGVGFRYYIVRHAERLGLTGYTKNIYTGEVQTVVEGEVPVIEELFSLIRTGPGHASVKNAKIYWSDSKDEFTSFKVRY